MEKIKVILVDDHEILMDGVASILNDASNIQVVGKASSVAIAKNLIQRHQPDLVLTDISMAEESGLELTTWVTHQFPLIKIIVLSMHNSVQHISSLLEAGASGYLLKSVKQDEMFVAIENVMAGKQYIQHALAAEYIRARQQKKEVEKQSLLSPREIEIIRLIAQQHTTAEISRQLFLSEYTVETHRKNIGRKTGVKTVIGLVNFAREQGLI